MKDGHPRETACLAIVLHAHLPFVRHPEHEYSLEENWLYECLTETYIPLLLMLDDLARQRIDFRITISISPTLASMLADPLLKSRYMRRLDLMIELAAKELKRTRSEPLVHPLSKTYNNRLLDVREAFTVRYGQDLISAFGRLQSTGKIEIIASAATHGYLPLLSADQSAVRAQIRTGIDYYRRLFGIKPRGFWLPECAFYPGLDKILFDEGIRYTILETHGITRARPTPANGVYAPVRCPSGLAVFGRDPESSRQVWSSEAGYPGDFDYREFYRDIAYDLPADYIGPYIHPDGIRTDTGFKYYRVTGSTDHKEVYCPKAAEKKAHMHAADFISKRIERLGELSVLMDREPVFVAPFDAELFGHWWHEGLMWLDFLIRMVVSGQNSLRLITLSEYLDTYPDNQIAAPSMSSWGEMGYNKKWLNKKNDWIYRHIHRAATVMNTLAKKSPGAHGLTRRALNQAGRELLLAQASDWAFMIDMGATADYASGRIKTHLMRLDKLARQIEGGAIDKKWLSEIEGQDNIFPKINYNDFI
jgi:1,4-alpha-glucan branching enzyme